MEVNNHSFINKIDSEEYFKEQEKINPLMDIIFDVLFGEEMSHLDSAFEDRNLEITRSLKNYLITKPNINDQETTYFVAALKMANMTHNKLWVNYGKKVDSDERINKRFNFLNNTEFMKKLISTNPAVSVNEISTKRDLLDKNFEWLDKSKFQAVYNWAFEYLIRCDYEEDILEEDMSDCEFENNATSSNEMELVESSFEEIQEEEIELNEDEINRRLITLDATNSNYTYESAIFDIGGIHLEIANDRERIMATIQTLNTFKNKFVEMQKNPQSYNYVYVGNADGLEEEIYNSLLKLYRNKKSEKTKKEFIDMVLYDFNLNIRKLTEKL